MTVITDNLTGQELVLPEINVADFKEHVTGCLQGFITFSVARSLIISGAALFEKGGNRWIKWPEREWKDSHGMTHYAPVIQFVSAKVEREFRHAVLDALERYRRNGYGG